MGKFISIISLAWLLYLLVGCGQKTNTAEDIYNNSSTTTSNERTSNEDYQSQSLNKSSYVVNTFSDATMSIVKNTVTSNGLTVEFTYDGNNEGLYGSWYTLEVYNEDQWNQLPYTYDGEGEIGWTAEAYSVNKGEPRQEAVNWNWLYGELPSGHYRIIKDFSDFRGTGNYTEYYLAAEFSIE